jgi:predicted methyltransferase
MYDQSKLSELIRFARVAAGSTVIDVYPGDGDWTRLFSDVVGRGEIAGVNWSFRTWSSSTDES